MFFCFLKASAFKVTDENLFPAVAILSSDITEALGKHLILPVRNQYNAILTSQNRTYFFLHEGKHGPKKLKFIIFAHESIL